MIADVMVLFLTGFVSLLGQITLLRELNVASYGIELIYIIGLGVWMLLTAAGALTGGRTLSSRRLAILFLGFAFFLPSCIVFLRASRFLLGGIPGAYLPFSRQMAALVIALLPAGLISGLLFREAAGMHVERGKTLAGAYGIESAGSLLGGLLATICSRYGMQNLPLAVVCGLIAAVVSIFLFRRKGAWAGRAAALLLSVFLVGVLHQSSSIDRRMTGWNHPGLLVTEDSPYGRITATILAGQVSVFVNDALAFESGGREAELFSHITALQHPEPRRILVLGGGWDGTLSELLRHRPVRIDAVLLNLDAINLLRRYLPQEIRASLANPAVRMTRADPRQYLKNKGFAWDLILVAMPEPTSGETNRFYTREFFSQCAARLHPGGIVALRLPTAENLWTPQMSRRTASVYQALASVFPEILVLSGATTLMTASATPLPRSPEILIDRLRERGFPTRLVTPPYIRYLFTNDRFIDVEKRLKETKVPVNTDIQPVCYSYALLSWLSRFFPRLALVDLPGMPSDLSGIEKSHWPFASVPTAGPARRCRGIYRHRHRVGPDTFLPGKVGDPVPGDRPAPCGIHGRSRHWSACPAGPDPGNGHPEAKNTGVGRRPAFRILRTRFRNHRHCDRRGGREPHHDGRAACGDRISGRRSLRLCRSLQRPGTEEGDRPIVCG